MSRDVRLRRPEGPPLSTTVNPASNGLPRDKRSNGSADQTPIKPFYSPSTSPWGFITSVVSQLVFAITGMLGLAQYAREIVKVYPTNPASLQIRDLDQSQPTGPDVLEDGHHPSSGQEHGEISLRRWIENHVPSLKETFKPTWWLPNGHLQTMYCVVGDFSKIDRVEYSRTYLRIPDGGTLGLDFTPPNHETLPDETPTVVVCHGLTGGSHESYVRSVLSNIIRPVSEGGLAVRAVVVHFRGCAGVPLTSTQMYSAGTTCDLSQSLHYLRHRYPKSPLHGLGFSLGASVLSNYLGSSGADSLLSSGVAVGTPWDLPSMTVRLECQWFYRTVYSKAMGRNLLNLFFGHYKKDASMWDGSPRLGKEISSLKRLDKTGGTLKTIDEVMVSKIGGPQGEALWPFKGADEYYQWASSKKVLGNVRRPLLGINAFDDPIIDGAKLPIDEVTSSMYVSLAVVGAGGHLGWFSGRRAEKRWVVKPITEFLKAAVRDIPIAGPSVSVHASSASEETEVHQQDSAEGSIFEGEQGEWEWVDKPAHGIQGIEVGTRGKVGWRVLKVGEKFKGGAEGESGTLQGL